MSRSWILCCSNLVASKYLAAILSITAVATAVRAAGEVANKQEPSKTYSVRVVHDVAYRDLYAGENAAKGKNKLDLYLPKGRTGFPVIFFVHGGAWTIGDKNHFGMYSTFASHWAHQGVGVVVINYRLSPSVQHPAHIKDVARAFAWTHANIQQYGGRADQLFLCGHSAGGHLVALLASDESYLKAERLSLQAIKGVMPISGVYRVHNILLDAGATTGLGDQSRFPRTAQSRIVRLHSVFGDDPEARKRASPIVHVRPGLPPFLVIYADHDLPLLPAMAREFGTALKEKYCDVQVLEVKKRDHISILLDAILEGDPVEKAMRTFMERQNGK